MILRPDPRALAQIVHYGIGGQLHTAAVSRPVVAALVLVVSGVLFFVGRWGRRNAASLVPAAFSPTGRAKREKALRRGVFSCQVVAVILVLAAIGILVLPGA